MAGHETLIKWREWGDEAFAEARARDVPILLDIGAVWCHWCHVMDTGIDGDPTHTGTYSHPEVVRRIEANFVPVKVDNDRRPDINARYNMGGWPTTAFLTPDGETLYGETYVPPPRMVALLDHMHDAWTNKRDEIALQADDVRRQRADAEQTAPSGELDPQTIASVVVFIKRNFDFAYGGFGAQPKFPHPAALQLALEEYARTGDAELRTVAEKTLAGMADGGMYDQYAGGFFRYSTTRDWSVPHYEKMLEDNAKLTTVYALASQVLGESRYLDIVKSAHGWLLDVMRDPETGAFAGSQDADKEEAYYGEPLDVRATLPTPFIDRTIYTGWNCLMVSSLIARWKLTSEQDILDAAASAFGFVKDALGSPDGLRHFFADGRAQGSVGLLADLTDFAQAALDLYEATSEASFMADARHVADAILALEDKEHGGFFDIAPDPTALGELARPKKDMTENADAALALLRLSAVTDDTRLRQAAERALQLFADECRQSSFFASAYARAVGAALAPPLHIVIVGEERRGPLTRTAWQVVGAGGAVEILDADTGKARNFPAAENGAARAYVCVGTNCRIAATPEELRTT